MTLIELIIYEPVIMQSIEMMCSTSIINETGERERLKRTVYAIPICLMFISSFSHWIFITSFDSFRLAVIPIKYSICNPSNSCQTRTVKWLNVFNTQSHSYTHKHHICDAHFLCDILCHWLAHHFLLFIDTLQKLFAIGVLHYVPVISSNDDINISIHFTWAQWLT